ncbi:hypothetical protein QWI17_15070 [Gilvimarinus sp. SDUM040013]|uniref:DUF4386 domain-containing protein n=1 Tax=Gilvimarinus gilvus TaxID=3058038 RepID=A0ABU4S1L1_9GAMM|nr:hypothetical protein [Gilvimarinus sp. SDUM040013]MDO3387167.1 hypothetical protein [Gilvimarinus sp. SDUM040013]MDX6850910.1 hypothetical protein [Gilvimarinus sp. SDUM040013]
MFKQLPTFYLIHIIVVIICIACLLMNGPMRGGFPIDNTVADRMAFIADNGLVWTLSWSVWMLSALGLFVFCAILADNLRLTLWRTIGLALVGMGIAPDLIAEVLYAFVMPKIVAGHLGVELFSLIEVIAMHLTGFLGNGLYNLGGMLLTCLAVRENVVKGWVAAWGLLAWFLGLMLSLSVGIGSIALAEIFTAASMVLSTLWMLIFAHKVLKA